MKIANSPPIVKIAFFTLITVIVWISFDVYRAFTVEPSSGVPEEILKDLNPFLDVTTLNQLQNRIYIADEQIPDINITPKDSVSRNANESVVFIEELPESADEFVFTATESAQP